MTILTINQIAGWKIILRDKETLISRFAAAELEKGFFRARAASGDQPAKAGEGKITLGYENRDDDGWRIEIAPNQINLTGHNERGLLYAVYALLEKLGFCWVDIRQPYSRLYSNPPALTPGILEQTPAFGGRCLILGHHAFLAQGEDWIAWAAANRFNTIFFHVSKEALTIGAAPEAQYQRKKEALVYAARQRGMIIEHGGHLLSELLPRHLFRQHPEYFRLKKRRRTPDHNFCPTNPQTLEIICQHAAEHFRSHPEVDIFHLWGDDLPDGGWCECPSCRRYSPSEQLLLATNALAEVLAEINPQAQISFLAYHDTESAPVNVTPRKNVCLLWAPRMRCYGHPLGDKACPVNTPYYIEAFQAQVECFRKAGASPPRVFEYYGDAILFKSVLPPLMEVMQGDLQVYQQTGAHAVQILLTGDAPFLSPQINPWCFGRLVWEPRQDLYQLVRNFNRAVFETDLPGYFTSLQAAYQPLLELSPHEIHLTMADSLLGAIKNPPVDIGDPVKAPPDILEYKVRSAAVVEQHLVKAGNILQKYRERASGEAWRNEMEQYRLHRSWLHFNLARLELYLAIRWKDKTKAVLAAQRAEIALQEVLTWGKEHFSDVRYQVNWEFLHRVFWQLRLDKIRGEKLSHFPRGLFLRIRGLLRVLTLLRKMRFIYHD